MTKKTPCLLSRLIQQRMNIRKYDDSLKEELEQYTSCLIVSYNNEAEALLAAEEVSTQYYCLLYCTEDKKYYNVYIPATMDGKQVFTSDTAYEYGKNICQKYNGVSFVTDFGDRASFDKDGDLTTWFDCSCFWDD